MSDISRTATPDIADEGLALDVKPTLPGSATLTQSAKARKSKAKATAKRKSSSSNNDITSFSTGTKPVLDSDIDEKPSPSKKRAEAKKSNMTPKERADMFDEIITAGLKSLGSANVAVKYSLTTSQMNNMVQKGQPSNWRAKILRLVGGE